MGCFFHKNPILESSEESPLLPEFTTNRSFQYKSMPSLLPISSQASQSFHETLKILTFNILADSYISTNFSYCDKNYIDFTYRGPQILHIIESLNADIICLQEVDHYKDFYQSPLSKTYELYEEKRGLIGSKDGLLTGFKRNSYKLQKKVIIYYDNYVTADLFDGVFDYERYKKGNIALILELISSKSNEKFIIVNTHLHWDPKEEDVKKFQTLMLFSHLQSNYERKDRVFICGDFNSLPDSEQISILQKESFIDFSSNLKKIIKKLPFQRKSLAFRSAYSRYRQRKTKNLHPAFTNYTSSFKGVLDYIFYSRRSNVELRKLLKIPKSKALSDGVALPNKEWPSDHLPLMAEFIIEKYIGRNNENNDTMIYDMGV